MAGEDKILKVLLQIQSDISDLGKLKSGVDDVKKSLDDTSKSGFTLGDAFKFAGAEEALHGILSVLKSVGEAMIATLEKAAELQSEAFPLTAMIGSAEKAKQIIGDLDSLWQQFGVVSSAALADAARNLIITGTLAQNLIPRLTEMVKIHVATGIELNSLISAYERLKMSIQNETEPMIRGIGGFSAATIELLRALEAYFSKIEGHTVTQAEILTRFKTGLITLQDVNAALRQGAEAGGIFSKAIEDKKNTFEGAVMAMKTAWQGFEVEIGKPLIDALTPVVHEIGNIERALAKIGQEKGWQVALQAAWTIVIDEMARIVVTVLTEIFTKLGPSAVDAFWTGFVTQLKNVLGGKFARDVLADEFGKAFVESLSPIDLKAFGEKLGKDLLSGVDMSTEKAKKLLEDTLKSIKPLDVLPKETPETLDKVGKGARDVAVAMRELETELQKIHQQQQLIQQNPFLSVDDKQLLLIKSYSSEVGNLQSQIAKLSALKAGPLDPAQLAEVNQKLQQANFEVQLLQQKLGGLQQPLKAELASWVNSFGDTMHQVGKTIEDSINTSLQAFNQLLITGKFNAQQLESSLAQIALKLIEQIAIAEIARALGITEAKVTGPALAEAYGPAATLATIASYGVAADAAPLEIGGAIAAVAGLAVAHEGGVVGSLPPWRGGALASDERLTVTKIGELILPTNVVPRMHEGGVVGGGANLSRIADPKIEVHLWRNEAEAIMQFNKSAAGRKHFKELKESSR